MKALELREMTVDELRRRLDEIYQEMFNLRFQLVAKQLSDTSRVRQVRRDIARLKTELRQRTLQEAGQE